MNGHLKRGEYATEKVVSRTAADLRKKALFEITGISPGQMCLKESTEERAKEKDARRDGKAHSTGSGGRLVQAIKLSNLSTAIERVCVWGVPRPRQT